MHTALSALAADHRRLARGDHTHATPGGACSSEAESPTQNCQTAAIKFCPTRGHSISPAQDSTYRCKQPGQTTPLLNRYIIKKYQPVVPWLLSYRYTTNTFRRHLHYIMNWTSKSLSDKWLLLTKIIKAAFRAVTEMVTCNFTALLDELSIKCTGSQWP